MTWNTAGRLLSLTTSAMSEENGRHLKMSHWPTGSDGILFPSAVCVLTSDLATYIPNVAGYSNPYMVADGTNLNKPITPIFSSEAMSMIYCQVSPHRVQNKFP